MNIREKPTSADNQQERSKEYFRGYLAGLVDGEGSFHIAFACRKDLPLGISVIPEFHISQNEDSKFVLELARDILGCGYIKPNHSKSRDKTFVYVVRDRIDLKTKVIPFFHFNRLLTTKQKDFNLFTQIVDMMINGSHRTVDGLKTIIVKAYEMNGGGSRRARTIQEVISYLKSSTTT